jgi:hypothetical protein
MTTEEARAARTARTAQQRGDATTFRGFRKDNNPVDEQGYREDGRKRSKGYSPPPPYSNVDYSTYLNQGLRHEDAVRAAQKLRREGNRISPDGKIVPDDNVSDRVKRLREEHTRQANGTAREVRHSVKKGPTDQQRGWAQKFQEGQPKESQPTVQDKAGFNPMSPGADEVPASSAAPKQPPNFSRSALVEGAKRSGDFDGVRKDYNTKAAGTGMQMDGNGLIKERSKTASGPDGTSDYARDKWGAAAEDIRARRDFASGRTVTTSGTTGLSPDPSDPFPNTGAANSPPPTQAADFRRTIGSKYGTGSNVSRQPGDPSGGTMPDPLTNKQVPVRQWAADQSAVQATKQGPDTGRAGEDFFKPAQVRQSVQGGTSGAKGSTDTASTTPGPPEVNVITPKDIPADSPLAAYANAPAAAEEERPFKPAQLRRNLKRRMVA